jgi:hypothetical protein
LALLLKLLAFLTDEFLISFGFDLGRTYHSRLVVGKASVPLRTPVGSILAEVLARLERMVVSRKPEAAKAVAKDAATARREAQRLLSYVSTSEWSIGSLRNLVDFLALGL